MTDLSIRLIYVFVATSAHMDWAKWAPVVAIGYATTDYIGFRLAVACAYNYYVTSASCRWRGEATTGISAHWDPGSAQSVLRLQGGKNPSTVAAHFGCGLEAARAADHQRGGSRMLTRLISLARTGLCADRPRQQTCCF